MASILEQNDPKPTRSVLEQNDPKPDASGKKPTKKSKQGDLPRDYNWGDVPGGMWDNVKQDAADFAGVLGKAYHDPIAAADRAYQSAGSVVGAIDGALRRAPTGAAAVNAMMGVPAAVGDYLGTNYGDEGSIKRSLVEHPYRSGLDVASAVTLPGVAQASRAVGTAVAARVPTAVTRTAQAARYAAVPTHAINDATHAVASRVIPGAARQVNNVLNPTSELMMKSANGQGPAINAMLHQSMRPVPPAPGVSGFHYPRTEGELVKGSYPTASQVASDAGATGFSALGKTAEKHPSAADAATATVRDQNAAQIAQAQRIGKTPDVLNKQVASDKAISKAEYGAFDRTPVKADQQLLNMFDSPSMPVVFKLAEDIAKEKRRPFSIGKTAPAHTSTSTILGPNGRPLQVNNPATFATYSGEDLGMVKRAFDRLAFDKELRAKYSVDDAMAKAIIGTRGDFINWLEHPSRLPAHKAAREGHAARRTATDQMRFGQAVEKILKEPLKGDETLRLKANQLAAALETDVRRADGYLRDMPPSELLTPEQMKKLYALRDDLARQAIDDDLATRGAGSAGDLNKAFSDVLHISPDNPLTRLGIRQGNKRVASKVAPKMNTAAGAAELMKAALERDMNISKWDKRWSKAISVNSMINPARWANRYPILINAMNAPQDQGQR